MTTMAGQPKIMNSQNGLIGPKEKVAKLPKRTKFAKKAKMGKKTKFAPKAEKIQMARMIKTAERSK